MAAWHDSLAWLVRYGAVRYWAARRWGDATVLLKRVRQLNPELDQFLPTVQQCSWTGGYE